MRAKIGVATVSGKAYYKMLKELKERSLPFLSLVPGQPIPPSILVVITTEKEKSSVNHPTVLVYDPEADASEKVDEAIRVVQRRGTYGEVVVGVDPGKTFGVAVLADGRVLKKQLGLTLEVAVNTVLDELQRNSASSRMVKIENGIPQRAEELAARLEIALPENTTIEMVSEEGISNIKMHGHRKRVNNAESAVEIARMNGTTRPRREDS